MGHGASMLFPDAPLPPPLHIFTNPEGLLTLSFGTFTDPPLIVLSASHLSWSVALDSVDLLCFAETSVIYLFIFFISCSLLVVPCESFSDLVLVLHLEGFESPKMYYCLLQLVIITNMFGVMIGPTIIHENNQKFNSFCSFSISLFLVTKPIPSFLSLNPIFIFSTCFKPQFILHSALDFYVNIILPFLTLVSCAVIQLALSD